MRRAIEMCHAAGLDVWFMAGMYTAYESLMYCPGNPENSRWYEAYYTHLATAYGVQGIDITHARIPRRACRGAFSCVAARIAPRRPRNWAMTWQRCVPILPMHWKAYSSN